MNASPRIAVAVHGRFHAFDLMRELLRNGEDVRMYTNYPAVMLRKFGVDPARVRTNVSHGVATRCLQKIDFALKNRCEQWIHQSFARWAGREIKQAGCDVVHGFSGVCEEIFESVGSPPMKTLVRGSAHIETQAELLAEEECRAKVVLEKPSVWMRAREAREYQMADFIFVLSEFARQSFVHRGISSAKICLLPLGSELRRFSARPEAVEERLKRVRSGNKLRVLNVGTFSYRKGAIDLVAIAQKCAEIADFRFVGAVSREAAPLRKRSESLIQFCSKVPQFDLPAHYEWADLFVFPTIEDGYAVVLAQAQAAGLPILTTANCAGPELVTNGHSGWILPIRDAGAFTEKLRELHRNRDLLAAMARASSTEKRVRDWNAVARDFAHIQRELLETHGIRRRA
jgi:glycosyltransferase involved in cell wall biosynthesis